MHLRFVSLNSNNTVNCAKVIEEIKLSEDNILYAYSKLRLCWDIKCPKTQMLNGKNICSLR